MIAFISGHLDLTDDEFEAHYAPLILKAIEDGYSFVIGDAPGADTKAQALIFVCLPRDESFARVTVYHMLTTPRNNINYRTMGGFTSNNAKDKAMTADSDYDILWIRPEKHSSVSGRVSGSEQNQIRRKAKAMRS